MRPARACLDTQTPNSTEVCGQDGSELQLQGKASLSSMGAQTQTEIHTGKDTSSHRCMLCLHTPIIQREKIRETSASIFGMSSLQV